VTVSETNSTARTIGYSVTTALVAFGTLAAPGLSRLQEWAYAGIFFDLTGAVASHAACGDAVWHILAPAILAVASWVLRQPSRIVGTLVGVKGGQA
jgi:hypothetical protein